ncbi:unnamed protein product [Meganyctiphanes norvegica]|uniref:Gustatory receptor n=1 Tax=Meganyctiphanes norvegica TaxID=48144 RepID=A0AAV2RRY6_MEGNR
MVLKIMVTWRVFRKVIDEGEDSNALKLVATMANIIFAFAEDIPQITFQVMFYVKTVLNLRGSVGAIVDVRSWLPVLTIISSCLSLSKNFTEYSSVSHNRSLTSHLVIFATTFIAAGGRVLVCCLMAAGIPFVVSGQLTAPATWMIVVPVGSAVGVQLILGLAQFGLSCGRNLIAHTCLWTKTNVDSPDFTDVDTIQTDSTADSFAFTLAPIRNRSSPDQSNHQKLLNIIYKLGGGLRSILFSVTVDAHSLLGLYSSAVYATWALWFKMRYVTVGIRSAYSELDNNLVTTGLTLTMLSYTLNSVVVVKEGRHRYMSLVVSLVFVILPAYAYNLAAQGNTEVLYKLLFIPTTTRYDKEYSNATIATLNVTMAGLIITLNIIAIVIAKVKARNNETEKKQLKEYSVGQRKRRNVNNEDTNKRHTI